MSNYAVYISGCDDSTDFSVSEEFFKKHRAVFELINMVSGGGCSPVVTVREGNLYDYSAPIVMEHE